MNDTNQRLSADDIEALLPWYAAGTLDAQEADQVEAALAADAGLVRRLDLVREEMNEAIVLNEALGVPSPRVAEKLFSAIDREPRPARSPAAGDGWMGWLANAMSPRVYAFAAGAAALLIVAEAGIIAKMALQDRGQSGGPYVIQSSQVQPEGGRTGVPRALEMAFVQVQFSPRASMAEVTHFLAERSATIVEGPHRDGHYKLRLYTQKDELDRVVREFQSAGNLFASATLAAD
jgi:hypothetical protein